MRGSYGRQFNISLLNNSCGRGHRVYVRLELFDVAIASGRIVEDVVGGKQVVTNLM